ncbi:MAG: hypothetical protein KBS81_01640 [Spirochaetales bacterium]|nr:hypothetical protein [Candidatus Physcosoma equi]
MKKRISQWKAYSFLVEKLKELDRLKELPYAIIDFEYFENLKSEFGYQET